MNEIVSCIDTATLNINLVLQNLYSMMELDNSPYETMKEVYNELYSIKKQLEQLKKDIKSNDGVISAKRGYLGL